MEVKKKNKEKIKNLKIFAFSVLLAGNIVLSECNPAKVLNYYLDEEIKRT